MNYIRLHSEGNLNGKVATIMIGEAEGIRELQIGEAIHWREVDSNPICAGCGKAALVWFGSQNIWQGHPRRCKD